MPGAPGPSHLETGEGIRQLSKWPIHRLWPMNGAARNQGHQARALALVSLNMQPCLFLVLHRRCRPTADETVPHSSSGFLLDEWAATTANLELCLFLGFCDHRNRNLESRNAYRKFGPLARRWIRGKPSHPLLVHAPKIILFRQDDCGTCNLFHGCPSRF